ncbi:unnamed protein product [Chilo suppressalis]|uniref:Uncharacterized protein n=1 Tax=Chilo suppressalis TaxID=168631 RepID=A0ABN8AZ20_CHISP|nr:unnamed protein product [Chilo suppressalis]
MLRAWCFGPSRCAAWAWLAVLAALGHSTAYTDTEDFLSDLDKPDFVDGDNDTKVSLLEL